MIARYRNVSHKPPRLFPPKPPREARFRVTIMGRYTRWTVRLTETTSEPGRKQVTLEGRGVTPTDALYDLDHAVKGHSWGLPAGWERRVEALYVVAREIAREHQQRFRHQGRERATLGAASGEGRWG